MTETAGDQEKNMAIHIICPLANDQEGGFTVFCGLAPRCESFPQFGIMADTGVSTSAAPAVVESTGYHCRWTKINNNSIQNLARKLTNVVIPVINQKFDTQIPMNGVVQELRDPTDSTYIKMTCEEHKVVDYHDDRTTRYLRMPSFGATDKTLFESVASSVGDVSNPAPRNKQNIHVCVVCGHVSGNNKLSKLIDFTCKELQRHGVKITKDPVEFNAKEQQS